MDSYTFSSDSTSSFFVKETTCNEDDDSSPILHVNSEGELLENDNSVEDSLQQDEPDKVQFDTPFETANMNSNDIFIITVDDGSSNEIEDSCQYNDNMSNLVQTIKSESDFEANDNENVVVEENMDVEIQKPDVESASSETPETDNLNPLKDETQGDNSFLDDKSTENFDMEHFLSFKPTKTKKIAKAPIKRSNQSIKKYFTECDSNLVKCSLCADVLVNNTSNLLLHLRLVHRSKKMADNSNWKNTKVWNYFSRIDPFKAKCTLCSSLFIYKNRMSNLVKHLRVIHRKSIDSDISVTKGPVKVANEDEDEDSETATSKTSSSDLITIQNSEGKLLNQIKVNKSWKCFTKLPNSDKMICNLCKKIFTHNNTNDLLDHLHIEHKSILNMKQLSSGSHQALSYRMSDIIEETDNMICGPNADASKSVIVQKVVEGKVKLENKSLKTTKIWEYFTQLHSGKVKCNLCSKELASNFSTSNLLRHLNSRHPEAYKVVKEVSKGDETAMIKIMIKNDKGDLEDVSVADMLADYQNMLLPEETTVSVIETKPPVKQKHPVSETWRHFAKIKNTKKVKCKICKITLVYNEGVSSNLTRHLKLKHKHVAGKIGADASRSMDELSDTEEGLGASNSDNIPLSPANSDTNKGNVDTPVEDSIIPSDTNEPSVTNNEASTSELPINELNSLDEEEHIGETHEITNQIHSTDNDTFQDDDATSESQVCDGTQKTKVWNFFKKMVSKDKAICKICARILLYRQGSVYHLLRHLSLKHDITFEKIPRPRKEFAFESDQSDEESCSKTLTDTIVTEEIAVDNGPAKITHSSTLSSEDDLNDTNNKSKKPIEIKGTNRTWKNFTKLDRDTAKCNFCSKLLTYKLGQTANLVKHIQLEHNSEEKSDKEEVNNDTNTTLNTSVENDSKSVKKVEPKASMVWKYFSKLDDLKAMCNLCEYTNILSYTRCSRSNLLRHLNRKHKYVLSKTIKGSVSNQSPDISIENGDDDDNKPSLIELNNDLEDDNMPINDMQSLFDYLTCDEKLKNCIKFDNNQIRCKICSGSFVCDNLINYEYTIRYHIQIFHAEWTVMCVDDSLIKRECTSPLPDNSALDTEHQTEENSPVYNELEAIANEVNLFMASPTPPKQPTTRNVKEYRSTMTKKQYYDKTVNDNIWSFFTKMTSQNVRCNYCSILLSFRRHKKWNLLRHLKLKHRSKLNAFLDRSGFNFQSEELSQKKKEGPLRKHLSSARSKPIKKTTSSVVRSKSLLKKAKRVKPLKVEKIHKSSIRMVKSKKDDQSEKIESSVVETKPNSPVKKAVKKNVKDDTFEKSPVPLASINAPINRKIGRTWSHFTKIEMGTAQCNICGHVLFYRGSGIDILNDHLTSNHKDYFNGTGQQEERKSYFKAAELTNGDSNESADESYVNDTDSSDKESNNIDGSSKNDANKPIKKRVSLQPKTVDKEITDSSKKQVSPAWLYFTRVENGYAKCHLCLSEISYRGTTSNLMRHLQKIHSVISLLQLDNEDEKPVNKTESEKSKLLAAVDLTPAKVQDVNQLCFIRINRNVVKCNFCPRILYHKCGNMHKLMSHMLFKHRHVMKRYKSLKNIKFHVEGNKISLAFVNRKQNLTSLSMSTPPEKIDKRKIYRSNTWLYFTKLGEHHAKCNKCDNTFSYKGGSIYNLTRHLLIKHDVKLIKRMEMPLKKLSTISTPMLKSVSISKRKEALLFFKRINRRIIRCKLCLKRFTYNGVNVSHLVNHLWLNHISKLMELNSGLYSLSDADDSDSNSGDDDKPDSKMECDETHTVADDIKENTTEGEEHSGDCNDESSTPNQHAGTWNYFTDLNDEEKNVKCNICQRILCFRSGNLGNLSRHLEKNHNIKKSNDSNHSQMNKPDDLNAGQVEPNDDNGTHEQKPKNEDQFMLPFTVTYNKEKDKFNKEKSELFKFFKNIENCKDDEVQCKICNGSVEYSDNKLINLKTHLSLKHGISDLGPKEDIKNVISGCDVYNLPSPSKNVIIYKTNNNTGDSPNFSKMKCKLCYKEFIDGKNRIFSKLLQHLKTDHDLPEHEKQVLNEVDEDFCDTNDTKVEGQNRLNDNVKLKRTVLTHFKDLKSFKNKCKVCNKFISNKKTCFHRITNDLSIKYGVCKAKRKMKNIKISKRNSEHNVTGKGEDEVDKHKPRKIEEHNDVDYILKHFMSVHLYENKCLECMALSNNGYCVHSLNLWITNENKKIAENSKPVTSEYNQVSLTDKDVQMITDSLGECNENNIIIITDNQDTSVLNYNDITNRNENVTRDISYQIMNSINDIDDDDIKVIIYNYNSEDATDNNQGSSIKIQDVTEDSATNAAQSSNKALEEHINNIVNELNSQQLLYNNEKNHEEHVTNGEDVQTNHVQENEASVKDKNPSMLTTEGNVEPVSKPYDLEKLTELAEVSCNEQFYKQNSFLTYSSEGVETADPTAVSVELLSRKSDSSDRCVVESIYPENEDVCDDTSNDTKCIRRSSVVFKTDDVSEDHTVANQSASNDGDKIDTSDDVIVQDQPQEVSEASPYKEELQSKHNEVLSEEVINAIFNEVIVNLHENADQEKELSLIKLVDGNVEIPTGLYLQNFKSLYKVNKGVIYFTNIDHEYKMAKCNLCDTYLQFDEPIIYNLLMHLFTHHKDKVCTEESINKELDNDSKVIENITRSRRKSPVWKYFANEKNFRATCKICGFSFSFKGGAINNLSRHLRLRHNILLSSKSVPPPEYENINFNMLPYPKRRSSVKLRSKTWTYFSKEPNDWAKCKICNKYLSYRSSTINNLTRHLRTIHSKIFNCLFTDKKPIFIKNEDGTLSANTFYTDNEGNNDLQNSLLLESSSTKTRDEILQRCSYSSLESNNKKKSIVWNYFSEVSPSCGKCNFCTKIISCKGGGTSNLSRHLRSKHGIWIVLTSNLSHTFNETLNDPEMLQTIGDTSNVTANSDSDTIITQEQLHILKSRKIVHKRSKTWDYFTKESNDRVSCNLCRKLLSYKCKAVHNLRRHLAKKHPSYIVKPEPIRLKLQITTENDVLHNTNEIEDSAVVSESNKKFIDITDTSVVIVDEENQMPPNRPERNARPKKSIVWNYFEELEYGVAKCLICSKILSFRGGGTNNLMRHLRCRHSIIIVNNTAVDWNPLKKGSVVLVANENNDKDDNDSVKTNNDQDSVNVVVENDNLDIVQEQLTICTDN